MKQILAICGSLRTTSSNRSALQAAASVAPEGMQVTIYEGLVGLPHFNPDLDRELLPLAAADLRERVARCDGLLISSPEYAHGIPGSLKNALDWLVGSTELAGKPAAIINTSPRAVHADAQLREVLTTMAVRLVSTTSFVLPLSGTRVNAGRIPGQMGGVKAGQ
jgi:chromate reductase